VSCYDTPAMNAYLDAVHDALNVARPAHPADDGLWKLILGARADAIRVSARSLREGALDNVALRVETTMIRNVIAATHITYEAVTP
jgi:hypothetical protein